MLKFRKYHIYIYIYRVNLINEDVMQMIKKLSLPVVFHHYDKGHPCSKMNSYKQNLHVGPQSIQATHP